MTAVKYKLNYTL